MRRGQVSPVTCLLLLGSVGLAGGCHFLTVRTGLKGKMLSKPRDFTLSGFRGERPMWHYSAPMGLEKFYIVWHEGRWTIYGTQGMGAMATSSELGPHNVSKGSWQVYDDKGKWVMDPDFQVACPKPVSSATLDPKIVEGMDENLRKALDDPEVQKGSADLSVYFQVLTPPVATLPSNFSGVYVRVSCSIAETCLALRDTILAYDDKAYTWVLLRNEYVLATAEVQRDALASFPTRLADRGDVLTWTPKTNETEGGAAALPTWTSKFLRPAAFRAQCDSECAAGIKRGCEEGKTHDFCLQLQGYPFGRDDASVDGDAAAAGGAQGGADAGGGHSGVERGKDEL